MIDWIAREAIPFSLDSPKIFNAAWASKTAVGLLGFFLLLLSLRRRI